MATEDDVEEEESRVVKEPSLSRITAPRMTIFLGVPIEKSEEDDDERSRWWCRAATPGARMMDTAAPAIVVAVVRASYLSFSRDGW